MVTVHEWPPWPPRLSTAGLLSSRIPRRHSQFNLLPPVLRTLTTASPSAIGREVRIAILGVTALLAIFDLMARTTPLVGSHLSTLVAATFLYLPLLLLPKSGPGLDAYGFTSRGLGRGLLIGAATAALFFPPFLIGQHVWVTQAEGLQPAPSASAYRQLPERLEVTTVPEPTQVPTIFKRGDRIEVIWAPPGEWTLTLDSDGSFTTPGGRSIEPASFVREGRPGTTVHIALHVRGGSELVTAFTLDGHPVAAEEVQLAGQRSPPSAWISDDARSLRIPLSLAWIPLLVLAHLLIVALPEELFFRGYLQKRLSESGAQASWRLAGIEITKANLIASVTFAVCHFVIGWDPLRLVVFFPSLVFGILRDRTDGIAAPIVCHALFNLMVSFTIVHYIPVSS